MREQDVSDLNLKPIDVGTANNIELRVAAARASRGGQGEAPAAQVQQPAPVQNAVANATVTPAQENPTPAVQPATPAPGPASPTTGQPALRFDPPSVTTTNGGTFTVNVAMNGGSDIAAVPVQITYDPKNLTIMKIDNGDFLTKDGQAVALVHRGDDTNSGTLVISAARPPGAPGVSGAGSVFTLTFMAKQKGSSVISITRPGARDSKQQPISVLGSQMTVNVQ